MIETVLSVVVVVFGLVELVVVVPAVVVVLSVALVVNFVVDDVLFPCA